MRDRSRPLSPRALLGASALALVVVSAAGCNSTADQLRARFAKENGCSAGVTSVAQAGNKYSLSGCGKSAVYICATYAGMNDKPECEEEGRMHGPQPEPDRATSPDPKDPTLAPHYP